MKGKTNEVARTSLKTAIYVRVSTDEQAQEGFSIRAQIDKLKAYALLKDWEIFDIYNDEGISGKNIFDRPAINRLIDDINEGKVNNVLVFKVDRLTRSTKNLLELVELFEENNCNFSSLTESIDTESPSGRMFLKIIGIFAEFERENLVSRLKLGFERKAKEGYTLANRVISYGYTKEAGQKVQEIHLDEAKIVKEIFSMYLDGNKSMTNIARTLNQRKIPTKMNGTWDTTSIKQILKNPTYIGKVRYSLNDESRYFEVEGQHERILPDEIYNSVQEKLGKMPKISRTKRPRERNYFCGVLVCACCGGEFSTHNYKNVAGEDKSLYKCVKKAYHKTENDRCKSPSISHDKVNAAFVEYIRNYDDFADFDDVEIDNDMAKRKHELQEYIKDCEQKLDNLDVRKKKITEQYVGEEISFEQYKDMLAIFNEKYDVLVRELERARAELPAVKNIPDVSHDDIINNLCENWDYLSDKEKMMFLQKFIRRIVIKVEKANAMMNIVKIEDLEFNNVNEQLMEKSKKPAVRSKLIGVQR